jgi:hypothetical protein
MAQKLGEPIRTTHQQPNPSIKVGSVTQFKKK